MTSLDERMARAASARGAELKPLLADAALEVLEALLRNPNLTEGDLVILLQRKNLPAEIIKRIHEDEELSRPYRVKLAIVLNPQTPRLVSIGLLKFLYLFDLVNVTLQPAVPTEIKRLAEEAIIGRMKEIPLGQKMTLARRGSGRVVQMLLTESQKQVVPLALDNPYLTEAHILKVLSREDVRPLVVESLARHEKWSLRYSIRLALVRNPLTPLARVLAFLDDLTPGDLRDIIADRRIPENTRLYIREFVKPRG